MRIFKTLTLSAIAIPVTLVGTSITAQATTLPGVGTFQGTAGILGANGDVTAPPVGTNYVYVTTDGSTTTGLGLDQGDETNGSELTTFNFLANAGAVLEYYFNYITSDGDRFSDYAYARLNDIDNSTSELIFTARTITDGNTVPGFGLPDIADGVTLDPETSPIIAGGPTWSPLGEFTGRCFDDGCGLTGWIKSTYIIPEASTYSFTLGVVNWNDEEFASGLAIAGLTVGDVSVIDPDVPAIPLPAGLLLLPSALLALRFLRKSA